VMEPANLVIVMSDQHSADVLGAYGNDVVRTPNIDRLCAEGVRFTAAYANSPICIPSRTSFATGRYVHELDLWDNDLPYDGSQAPSWGERLIAAQHHVTTIGKLHYAPQSKEKAFPDQRLPMHFVPDVQTGFLRGQSPIRFDSREYVEDAGPGESEYVRYDRAIADAAIEWLRKESPGFAKPWVLFVSFACPHFPLHPPTEFYELYARQVLPAPIAGAAGDWPQHPALLENRRLQGMDSPFTADEVERARRAYYGLVTFVDQQLGRILLELAELGLQRTTRVIYTSDHGESLGDHGLWWKSNMYDGAVRVPLVAAGPGVPADRVCRTPVALVDVFPTVMDGVGVPRTRLDESVRGESLWRLGRTDAMERYVFSEYHADFSVGGIFMVRSLRWKYVYYIGFRPQLFDLESDRHEIHDLANDSAARDIVAGMERALREIVDPEAVENEVRANQRARVNERGGVEMIMRKVTDSHSPPPAAFRAQ
jgi:choline-sulfatase